jgi:hypothetical protein
MKARLTYVALSLLIVGAALAAAGAPYLRH